MITVIIVSYKVPDLLLQCLRSLKHARNSNDLETIIVDNSPLFSNQNAVVDEFPEVIWIQNSANLGFAAAVNIGLKRASGEHILLLNPDTEVNSNAISNLQTFWETHPNSGIVGGKIVNSDGSFQKQCRRIFPRPASAFFRLFGLVKWFPNHRLSSSYEMDASKVDSEESIDAVSGACMSFKKDLLSKIGMFDEGYFLMGEDLDFCYRAKKSGLDVVYYPKVVIIHHHGASRRTRPVRSIYYGHYAMIRYYRKFLKNSYSPFTNFFVYCGILGHFAALSLTSVLEQLLKGVRFAKNT